MPYKAPPPYNPNYDAMPPEMVRYGHPAYYTRLICTMRELGLKEAADAVQDEVDLMLQSGGIYDTRDIVAERTHPDDPDKIMLYRLKTDAEIEVDAIMTAPRYMAQPNNGWLDLSQYIPQDKLESIYAFEREQQAAEARRLKKFGRMPYRW